MTTPGPDHPITLTPAPQRWRAMYAGHVIADSDDALILQEVNYPPVVYFPREDVGMEYMSRTERTTHCPHKGDANYYTVLMNGHIAENAVWTYEQPYPAMALIAGRLAFYPNKVKVYAVDDAAVNPRHVADVERDGGVGQVVQHTDSGAGAPQREPWTPNAETPAVPDDGGLR